MMILMWARSLAQIAQDIRTTIEQNVVWTADAFEILTTDVIWTLLALIGLSYARNEVREASAALTFAGPDPKNRRLHKLHRAASFLLFWAVGIASGLGLVVVLDDLLVLLSPDLLQIEPRRFIYRCGLLVMLVCIDGALVCLKMMRDIWSNGEMNLMLRRDPLAEKILRRAGAHAILRWIARRVKVGL